jgi:dolichol-phosphate mannosyltransferase
MPSFTTPVPPASSGPVRISLLVPCYNEEAVLEQTLWKVVHMRSALASAHPMLAARGVALEIVLVDDASTDDTAEVAGRFIAALRADTDGTPEADLLTVRYHRHEANAGKGRAIRTARGLATGTLVAIQDADLEYEPAELPRLLLPLLDGRADAVIGSRFRGGDVHRVLYFWHRLGNGALTLMSNAFTNLNLTDMECGPKAFTKSAFDAMLLTNDRFGIEPEIVARLSQMGARVYEVSISYDGRTYAEGKKIGWRDGVAAFCHILRAWWTSGDQATLRNASGVLV